MSNIRKNWVIEPPRLGEELDHEGYLEAETAWVLDKSTRHDPGDDARGWSIRRNGLSEDVPEDEFMHILMTECSDMVKVKAFDGFWSIKL
jgi:hypothetical protein